MTCRRRFLKGRGWQRWIVGARLLVTKRAVKASMHWKHAQLDRAVFAWRLRIVHRDQTKLKTRQARIHRAVTLTQRAFGAFKFVCHDLRLVKVQMADLCRRRQLLQYAMRGLLAEVERGRYRLRQKQNQADDLWHSLLVNRGGKCLQRWAETVEERVRQREQESEVSAFRRFHRLLQGFRAWSKPAPRQTRRRLANPAPEKARKGRKGLAKRPVAKEGGPRPLSYAHTTNRAATATKTVTTTAATKRPTILTMAKQPLPNTTSKLPLANAPSKGGPVGGVPLPRNVKVVRRGASSAA